MNSGASLQTWDVLKEFGFQPDDSVISEIRPGLGLDFGTFKLSASGLTNRWFKDVVMLTGIHVTSRTLADIEFEMPRQIDSREQCAAWLAWHLDRNLGSDLKPGIQSAAWLELGRANTILLPWVAEQAAYQARPYCSMEREWARPLLKSLKAVLPAMSDDAIVWFSFDGEVMKIRCGNELIAAAATGKAWVERYGLKSAELKNLPRRLVDPMVGFCAWDGHFTIGNWRGAGVIVDTNQP
jgi:hypothetical protein